MEIIRKRKSIYSVIEKNPCISGPVQFKPRLFKGQVPGVLWRHTEGTSDLTVTQGKLRRAELSRNVLH